MKTKPTDPISTALPTCGEVFHFVVTSLDLPAWADAFHDPGTKRRTEADIKKVSDQLRDWATEAEGRTPSRAEFDEFIRQLIQGLPRAKELSFILGSVWSNLLDDHADEVRQNATFLDRNGTRAWYALFQAPRTLFFLWALQMFLQRLNQSKGPILNASLNNLFAKIWCDTAVIEKLPEHPLHIFCFKHYTGVGPAVNSLVDLKTIAAWRAGEDKPSFDALGRHFAQFHDKLGLLLNFAFASLLEGVAITLRNWITSENWPECRRLMLGQAHCMEVLDHVVADALAHSPDLSLVDFEALISACIGDYIKHSSNLPRTRLDALDLRIAPFRVYEEYHQLLARQPMPPSLGKFCGDLEDLWKGTSLKSLRLKPSEVTGKLGTMREEHPDWCEALAGPLLAIEARLALCHETPTHNSLQNAFSLYQQAFEKSRYQAGTYTTRVAREALGLAAMLRRREIGGGAIRPWIKNVLSWWDLLGLGPEFNHENMNQRIELAESRFTDELDDALRNRLKSALPQLGLTHWNIGGLFGFSESHLDQQLRATPVDRRQKKPMSTTIVGRDQTALMESIDRGHLDRARELVRDGADLNFINSTGDTCVTKAFARKYYDLVLEILRRDHDPIRRETLLRVTNKKKISGLEQTISEGQVEILRELARWKSGRGEEINMSVERIGGQTPLYYAINCLFNLRLSPAEACRQARKLMPESASKKIRQETMEAVHSIVAKDYNPDGVLKCINYLINELNVELDAPNVYDNTALTCAAEGRLHDVAAMLLAAGASVNHRFQGGGTALVRAIQNDDYEMAKLLIEYCADYRLVVDALGRPIYLMKMSEKMRRLIPDRL